MKTEIERDMLAELRRCELIFLSFARAMDGADRIRLLASARRVRRLITIASAPGSIKAIPRGDYWSACFSVSPGRPLTALTDLLGEVRLYGSEIEALEAASTALGGS